MEKSAEVIHQVAAAFGNGVETTIAENLLEFLSVHTESSHITPNLVKQLIPEAKEINDVAILRTLQFLAGDSVRCLEIGFELIVDDENVKEISSSEFRIALADHIDPFTGDPDPAIADRILIFFYPSAGSRTKDAV